MKHELLNRLAQHVGINPVKFSQHPKFGFVLQGHFGYIFVNKCGTKIGAKHEKNARYVLMKPTPDGFEAAAQLIGLKAKNPNQLEEVTEAESRDIGKR